LQVLGCGNLYVGLGPFVLFAFEPARQPCISGHAARVCVAMPVIGLEHRKLVGGSAPRVDALGFRECFARAADGEEISYRGKNPIRLGGECVNEIRVVEAVAQPVGKDLLGVLRVTVFSPDDLSMVKEGPGERRRFLDDVLVSMALKYDALRLELDRIIKQRNTLLKQVGGRLDGDATLTLDVWDSKLADIGDQFGLARAVLVARLTPLVVEAYEQLADRPTSIELRYEPAWRQRGLATALAQSRVDDVRRGVSTVGPHRDDLDLLVSGMPARTHASQGEQRTLALALRLGAHRLVTDKVGSAPVLVLDDVLSELDPHRCEALLRHLPAGQVVLTTAGALPEAAHPDAVLRIEAGMVMS